MWYDGTVSCTVDSHHEAPGFDLCLWHYSVLRWSFLSGVFCLDVSSKTFDFKLFNLKCSLFIIRQNKLHINLTMIHIYEWFCIWSTIGINIHFVNFHLGLVNLNGLNLTAWYLISFQTTPFCIIWHRIGWHQPLTQLCNYSTHMVEPVSTNFRMNCTSKIPNYLYFASIRQ